MTPSLRQVLAYSGEKNFVAVSASVLVDLETPISIFARLSAGQADAFLLESVEGGEVMGRYSFMGSGARERFEVRGAAAVLCEAGGERTVETCDPLEVLKERMAAWKVWAPQPGLPRFIGGAVGYVGFDCVAGFEQTPLPQKRSLDIPDAALLLTDEVYIYDHVTHRLSIVCHAPLEGDREVAYREAAGRIEGALGRLSRPADAMVRLPESADAADLHVVPNRTPADFESAVRSALSAIEAGEVFQVVVSQRVSVEVQLDPFTLYRCLRALNPSPYMFYFDFGGFSVVGASPEVLVRLEDGELLLRPIAGTRRRGRDEAEDAALARELLADEKEVAEHRMLVDLGRNDLGRVAEVGSVKVDRLMGIERYSHVMHIVTDIRARLARGLDAFDAFRACFPAGTVSGAPKIRACELLAELEPDRRGLYAGAVGYFGVDGNMDTCIAIRTLVLKGHMAHIQAGAGIVHDSVPAREHEECHKKMAACLGAIALAAAVEVDT